MWVTRGKAVTQVLGEYCSHSYHPELPNSVTCALHVSVDSALTDERLSNSEGKQIIKRILTGPFQNAVSCPVSSSLSRPTPTHPNSSKTTRGAEWPHLLKEGQAGLLEGDGSAISIWRPQKSSQRKKTQGEVFIIQRWGRKLL